MKRTTLDGEGPTKRIQHHVVVVDAGVRVGGAGFHFEMNHRDWNDGVNDRFDIKGLPRHHLCPHQAVVAGGLGDV